MQRLGLCSDRATRGRLQASIVIGLAAVCAACLISGAPALAASRSASELRRAFAQSLLALRVTGNTGMCSSTSSEGRIALIEMLRGEELYLPSTTCSEAFVGHVKAEGNKFLGCGLVWSASSLEPVIKQAIIHARGNRATIKLTNDAVCNGEGVATGASAVAADPLGTSYWVRKRGRWLFDDRPTGTYSRAGRKAVAMLRAALSGRTVTWPEWLPGGTTLTVPFCTNGTTQPVFSITGGETTILHDPVLWYVAAGLTTGSRYLPGPREPPFDAHGDPQGEVIVSVPFGAEWNVQLVGGALAATHPPNVPLPVSGPGAAGC
jgi:hypothetical protein